MKKGTKKCTSCDGFFPEEETTFDFDGNIICYGCEQSAQEYMSSCIHLIPRSEIEKLRFCKKLGCYYSEFMDETGERYPDPIKEEIWKKTDGWRGHTEWIYNEGFQVLSDGWTTGWADETTNRKSKFNSLMEDLMDKIENDPDFLPVDMWIISGITSNVFSQVVDIVVRSEDIETLTNFLQKEYQVDKAELDYYLG